jgi:hypothetical protein
LIVVGLAVVVRVERDVDQATGAVRLPAFGMTVVIVVVLSDGDQPKLVALPGVDAPGVVTIAFETPQVRTIAPHPGIDHAIEVGIELFAHELAALIKGLLVELPVEVEVELLERDCALVAEDAREVDVTVEVEVDLGAHLAVAIEDVAQVGQAIAVYVHQLFPPVGAAFAHQRLQLAGHDLARLGLLRPATTTAHADQARGASA